MAATDGRGGAARIGRTGSPSVDRRHWFGGLGVAFAAVGLGLAAGVPGIGAGVGAALAWFLLPAPSAFAVGQLLAVAALSTDDPPLAVAVAELGLLSVLAGPLAETDAPGGTLAAFAVAALAAGAVGWGLLRTDRPLWLAGLAVAVVAATAAYGIHRYERVSMGLVTVDGEATSGGEPGDGSRGGSRESSGGDRTPAAGRSS